MTTAIVAGWFLWPTSLGGCTTLTIVTGHSMEPLYYTGDLVVSRCGDVAIGDVIVYQPASTGGARIIHRAVGGDATAGWEMKGDNNGFADQFTPRGAEVLGVARLHLPKVGLAAAALTSPVIWLSVIALAIALLLWPRGEAADDDEAADDGLPDDEAAELPDGEGPGLPDDSVPELPADEPRAGEPIESFEPALFERATAEAEPPPSPRRTEEAVR